MEYSEKLQSLRHLMKKHQIDAYLVPITDPHIGEYVPGHWRSIEWLTGFTGSAGTVIVTQDFAGLWTDSRYFLQAEGQLEGTPFQLVKLKIPHTPEWIDWLLSTLEAGNTLGYDGKVVSIGLHRKISDLLDQKNIEIEFRIDLIDDIWKERPELPGSPVFVHDVKYSGKTRGAKIADIRKKMAETGASWHLLTALDDIAWTFNLRAGDVPYSPLFVSYALIGLKYSYLFLQRGKIPDEIYEELQDQKITVLPYLKVSEILQELSPEDTIYLTPGTINTWLYNSIPAPVNIKEGLSFSTRMKAVKNETEIEHIRNVMIKDGIALTRFFIWLEKNIGGTAISEISASTKLQEFRAEQENFHGPSFATIAAYNAHGASPHYEPTIETDVELQPQGIFLLDSGGQYFDGTTDVTRTIPLSEPGPQERMDFTLALKGTINLAMIEFPLGTKGYQIEVLARKALWEHGLNYGHGTGHGVGFFLNVHEGPQTIGTGASGDMDTILEPGMLTADEPAIYREGKYGIRTENLLLCVPGRKSEFGQFLKFETVTLCYIDTSLIEKSLLTETETEWLNSYHQRVYNKLSDKLDDREKQWLKEKTSPI